MTTSKYNLELVERQTEIAQEIRDTFDLVSPFIEKHTSLICPECEKVCCADRHGRYDSDDLSFLKSLGVDVSQQESAVMKQARAVISLTPVVRFRDGRGLSDARLFSATRCLKALKTTMPSYMRHLMSTINIC